MTENSPTQNESIIQEAVDEILSKLASKGIILDELIVDGEWHPFRLSEYDKKRKGSYRALASPLGVDAYFKNFKDSSQSFSLQSFGTRKLTESELQENQVKMDQYRKLIDLQKEKQHEAISVIVDKDWAMGKEDLEHPYLKNKGLTSTYGTRSYLKSLMVPLRDINGKLWGLERISPDGSKYGVKNMKKTGLFHMIGTPEKEIFITEGFATGATLHQITGHCVVCAFGASNMVPVAEIIKNKYPDLKITISGDADKEGIKQSRKAAKRIGASYLTPDFKSPHPDYTDWSDKKEMEGEEAVREQIANAEKYEKTEHTLRTDWITNWLLKNDAKFHYSGLISLSNQFVSLDVVMSLMIVESANQGIKIQENFFGHALNLWIKKQKDDIWNETVGRISKFNPDGMAEMQKFMWAMTGHIEPEEIAVMLHFIWQVKRKANDLPVVHHLMPVLKGATGSGKSEAIKKLLSPVAPLWAPNSLDACSDERKAPFFGEFLVANMDEMGRAKFTELSHLKQTISAETIAYRPMRTNKTLSIHNKCTLIGSSNEDLDELIKDPTSVRRFFAINTLERAELTKNWELINSTDYLKLWHSVDHLKPSPILAQLTTVMERQETMRNKSSVELWAENVGLIHSDGGYISTKELYENYSALCKAQNDKYQKGYKLFMRELSKLGMKETRKHNQRGFKVVYSEG